MKKPLPLRREQGFSLVELMVVVLIIAVLVAIAIPSYLGARERTQDRAIQSMLTNASKVEAAFHADNAGFTANPVALAAEESTFDWTGATDESVHVVVGNVLPGDNRRVLLYSKSASGTWFGVRLDVSGPQAGRHSCRGDLAADVDDLADCVGTDW